jgi:hypothetical protein
VIVFGVTAFSGAGISTRNTDECRMAGREERVAP